MGQKVNPVGLRLGIVKGWDSAWFGGKDFSDKIVEDHKIRKYIQARIPKGGISRVVIERTLKRITLTIHTARPGVVIGKGGSEVELVKKGLSKLLGYKVQVNVDEIKRPGIVADLVGQNIAQQLEKKVNYRRAVKKSIQTSMSMGAEGIRICVSGRLNGAEIARSET